MWPVSEHCLWAAVLSSSGHLGWTGLELCWAALAAHWNHLGSQLKCLTDTKTHIFITQHYWWPLYFSFLHVPDVNLRNVRFSYYSYFSGMHKHHILSFSFHMCVTRQWEFIIKIPIPQEVIYNYKNTRVQVVHILPLASVSDATAFQPNRIMSVSWNALCGIWHILFCSNNEVSLLRKYSEKIIKEYI